MSETWDLKIYPCYLAVMNGPDHELKNSEFANLLTRFSDKTCLQVGVQPPMTERYAANFTTLDLYDQRPCIDVREDLSKTSFPDNHFDLIVCNAILEHVKQPFACVAEMFRIAKPGAEVWAEIPFVQPYHPRKDYQLEHGYLDERSGGDSDTNHGGDYWRFTPQGLVELMKPFKLIKLFLVNEGGVCFWGTKE